MNGSKNSLSADSGGIVVERDMSDPYHADRAARLNKGMKKRLAQPWSAVDSRRLQYHPGAFGAPRFGVSCIRNREADRRDAEIMRSRTRGIADPAQWTDVTPCDGGVITALSSRNSSGENR